MRRRFFQVGPPLLTAGVFLFALTGDFRAQEKKAAENPKLDAAVRNFLIEVTQKGIELYNQKRDYDGCARLFGRALLAVEPLLTHHPDLQQAITTGITKAQQTTTGWQHAFALREVLDKVRGGLAASGGAPATDKKPPEDKLPPQLAPLDKAPADKIPKDVAPKNDKGLKVNEATIKGRVTYKGKPLPGGTVVLVGAAGDTYKAPINADGSYQFRNTPAGMYKVAIQSGDKAPAKGQAPPVAIPIPERYQGVNTSGLSARINRGENVFDLDLQ
jgi:hypothetical protein